MKQENKLSAFILVFVLLTVGCKTMQPLPVAEIKPLPVRYPGVDTTGDSLHAAFHYLFTDPHLIRLIDTALKNNTDLSMANEDLLAAEARLSARSAAFLPTLEAIISGGAEKYGKYTMNGVGNFDTNLSPNITKDQHIPVNPTTDLFVGFRSSWELDIWGRLRHLKNVAQAGRMAVYQARQLMVTSLVAAAAEGYYTLLGLDKELEIVQRNIRLQTKAVEIVQAQKEGGRATELAVQQFTAQLLNTKAIQYRILQERAATENELNTLAGNYPQVLKRDTAFPDGTVFPLPAGAPEHLLTSRPDIRQAEYEMMAAKENVQAARAAFLPSLKLSPYLGLNAFNPSLLVQPGSAIYGVTGSLLAPLLQKRSIRVQYLLANTANRKTVYHYQQRLLNAYSEVSTQLTAVQNAGNALRLKAEEVRYLRNGVSSARELYLSGYASYLEVIIAQKTLLDAELQLTEQQKEISISRVRLYRALGGGWK